jgi:branched-chain amino acid transport system substrate-binding protein
MSREGDQAAPIHDGSLYADKLQAVFAREFAAMGGTITAQTAVDPNQTDMSSVLADIAAGTPEIIYFPIFQPAGPLIIQQARQSTDLATAILMGADGLFSPDVPKGAGDFVEGFWCRARSSQVPSTMRSSPYTAKFGSSPISIFRACLRAYNMIKAGIEAVAVVDADGTVHIGRQALRDALYGTKEFKGLTGVLTCGATGDCANPTIGVYEYHAGAYPPELIWPE